MLVLNVLMCWNIGWYGVFSFPKLNLSIHDLYTRNITKNAFLPLNYHLSNIRAHLVNISIVQEYPEMFVLHHGVWYECDSYDLVASPYFHILHIYIPVGYSYRFPCYDEMSRNQFLPVTETKNIFNPVMRV